MRNTIIFDFGNVFINLDIEKGEQYFLDTLGIPALTKELIAINKDYEKGLLSTDAFIAYYTTKFKHLNKEQFTTAWNAILKDFPVHRLEFLKDLQQKTAYKLILLSNTNTLHIEWIKTHVPFYATFKNCFDAFYLSHEIHFRKPNTDIFNFVLNTHDLTPESCVFIDDNKANANTAEQLGIATWHITPYEEDVTELFTKKSSLF